MAAINVLALFKANKNHTSELKHLLLNLLEPTRQEQGCMLYELHQDQEDPTNFFMYEQWESKTLLEQHLASEHINKFRSLVGKVLAEPIKISIADKL